jgi:hypothetical protein
MHGWIVTGGVIFWILVGVEVFALVIGMAASDDPEAKPGSGYGTTVTISLALFFVILFVFGDWSLGRLFGQIKSYPLRFLAGLALYVAIGIAWSFWYAYYSARSLGNEYRLARMEWLRKMGISGDSIPDDMLGKWFEHVSHDYKLTKFNDITSRGQLFSTNRARIVFAATYWPISMAWFFVADLCTELFDFVCVHLRNLYQGAIDFAFRDIASDFRKAEKD